MTHIFGGERNEITAQLEPIDSTQKIYGDEAIIESVAEAIFSAYDINISKVDLSNASSNTKYEFGLLIRKIVDTLCIVVPNDVNRSSDGVLTVRILKLEVNTIRSVVAVNSSQIAAIQRREGVKDKVALVSENASRAISRYIRKHDPTAVYQPPFESYQGQGYYITNPRRDIPKKKKSCGSCCCCCISCIYIFLTVGVLTYILYINFFDLQ